MIITLGSDEGDNLVGIPGQDILNCVGAFNDEGAILCPYAFIEEEFSNVRPLRARQEGK